LENERPVPLTVVLAAVLVVTGVSPTMVGVMDRLPIVCSANP
jgi:hypothetical protein